MIHKVIFATDFTPASRTALGYAAGLVRKVNATLLGTHAATLPGPIYSHFKEAEEELAALREVLEKRLEEFFSHVSFKGIRQEIRLCFGVPERRINQLAASENADLVILGRSTRAPIDRFFRSSFAEKILREAPCPVLVVPEKGRRTLLWSPVVCAVDFTPASVDAVHFATRLARCFRLELLVTHVIDISPDLHGEAVERYNTRVNKEVQARMKELLATTGAPSGTQIQVRRGNPCMELLKLADEVDSDLLILGSHGEYVARGEGIGSTASAALHAAKIPVMLIP